MKKRKLFFIISLNLISLLYFKYCNFFVENLNTLFSNLDLDLIKWNNILLPIGISFITFQSITYIVDVYRNDVPQQKKVLDYLLYIFLFPQLVAGPIVKYQAIQAQISSRQHKTDLFLKGFVRFSFGLAKKVLIANVLGEYYHKIFQYNTGVSADYWMAMLAYTLHIYFDFSGYSDMAIGLGNFFGFELPENFNRPYLSKSITEFWKRWHMTLGDFMKNYLYIPLGGNRVSNLKIHFNLIIVFFLSGLWHGASWNFILWGLFNVFWIILDKLFFLKVTKKIGFLAILLTSFICLHAWVFFSSTTLDQAITIFETMWDFNNLNLTFVKDLPYYMIFIGIALFIVILSSFKNLYFITFFNRSNNTISLTLLLGCSILLYYLSLISIVASGFNPFIYYQF